MKTTAEMIAVMQAYADGKKIEFLGREWEVNVWEECTSPLWDWTNFDYRIKPEQEYRPYINTHEFIAASRKHGFWLKEKESGNCFIQPVAGSSCDYQSMLDTMVWEDDGTPCGVLEE